MAIDLKFRISSGLFHKDPQNTDFGQKILKYSVLLIDKLGFESFTFKKLAKEISSTETSIYRYFENKHMLLVFLCSWYAEWVSYLIQINTKNISDPTERLQVVIHNIAAASTENELTEYINENVLHKIIVKEGAKAYHTIAVDKENKEGLFLSHKNLISIIEQHISDVNKKFPYKKSLASNLYEMANNQIYFSEHIPGLSDIGKKDKNHKALEKMLNFYTEKLLN